MPDTASIAVLRDVTMLSIVSLVIGFIAYGMRRQRAHGVVERELGNVRTSMFDLPDVVFAALLLFMLIGGLITESPSSESGTATTPSDIANVGTMIFQIAIMLGGATLILLWLKMVRGFDPVELFGLQKLRPRMILVTAIFWIVPSMIVVSVSQNFIEHVFDGVWPMGDAQEIVKSFQSSSSISSRIVMGITAALIAPVTEELMFRGLFYGVLKKFTDPWFAALMSALLFATVHLHVGSFVPLAVLALALVAAYEYTGSLLVPMAMHGIFNTVMLVAMLGDQ